MTRQRTGPRRMGPYKLSMFDELYANDPEFREYYHAAVAHWKATEGECDCRRFCS